MRHLYLFSGLLWITCFISNVKSQCDFGTPDGTYRAMWYLDQSTTFIKFLLQINQRTRKSYWTGIGFGHQMKGGDMIIVEVNDERTRVSDRHGTDYSEPIEDKQQDVKNFKGEFVDGILSAEFLRPLHTTDPDDLPLMDREKGFCQDFMFPLSGGVLVAEDGKSVLRKHFQIPVVRRMCNIDQCLSPELRSVATPSITSQPLPQPSIEISLGPQIPPRAAVSSGPEGPETRKIIPAIPQEPLVNNFVQPQPATPQTSITNGIIEAENTRLIPAPTPPQSPLQQPQPQLGRPASFQPERPPPITEPVQIQPVLQDRTATTPQGPHEIGMCMFNEGDYEIHWTYNATQQAVSFYIDTTLSLNKWTGIGFGQTMTPGDMIILYDGNGLIEISDRHSNGHAEPLVDAQQNILVSTVNYNGERVQAIFSRRIITGDYQDLPLQEPGLNGCQYFMFPTNGGELIRPPGGGRPQIGKHTLTPRVKLICNIDKCFPGAPETFVPVPVASVVPTSATTLETVPPLPPVRTSTSIISPVDSRIEATKVPERNQQPQVFFQNKNPVQNQVSESSPPRAVQQNNLGGNDNRQTNFRSPNDQSPQGNINRNGNQFPLPSNTGPSQPVIPVLQPQIGPLLGPSVISAPQLLPPLGSVAPPIPNENLQTIPAPRQPPQQQQQFLPQTVSPPQQQQQQQLQQTAGVGNVVQITQKPSLQRQTIPPLPSSSQLPQNIKPTGRKVQCPSRDDHSVCKVYVDDYFSIVFAEFPKIDQIVQKACIILKDHQDGIVYSECCHYLSQICTGFI